MGNFFTDLFGGGGIDTKHSISMSGQQFDYLNNLANLLNVQLGQGITPYGGQRIADFSPLQLQSLGLAGGLGEGIGTGISAYGDVMNQFNPALGFNMLGQGQDLIGRATQDFDPSLVMGALDPGRQLAMNTFWQDIAPDIAEKYGATSGASGPMNKAMMEAASNLSLGLGAQAAPYLMQGYENQLNRQLQGSNLLSSMAGIPGSLAMQGAQLGGMNTDLLTQLFNMGAQQQGLNQQQLSALQNKWAETQPYNNPWLNLTNSVLAPNPYQTTYISPQGSIVPALGSYLGSDQGSSMMSNAIGGLGSLFGQGISGLGSMFGGAASGAGSALGGIASMIGGLFSDERLKEDVRLIEGALEKIKSIKGVFFKWNDRSELKYAQEGTQIGVIAQDVEKVLPEAVEETRGFKQVSYRKLIPVLIEAIKKLSERVDKLEVA